MWAKSLTYGENRFQLRGKPLFTLHAACMEYISYGKARHIADTPAVLMSFDLVGLRVFIILEEATWKISGEKKNRTILNATLLLERCWKTLTVNIVATTKSDLLDSCILCVCRMSAVYSSCSYPIFGVVDVKSDGEEADELAGQCTDLHQRWIYRTWRDKRQSFDATHPQLGVDRRRRRHRQRFSPRHRSAGVNLVVSDRGITMTSCAGSRSLCTRPCTPHAAAQLQPVHALRLRRPAHLAPWIVMIDIQRLALGRSVEYGVVHRNYVVTWTANQSGLVTLTFDLLTLRVVSVWRGLPLCQF